jgi:hypothetical protein
MLRYEVCLVLRDAGQPLTISEIVARVRCDGFELPDNANKAVSDALRWELRRKRVDRVRRGLYAAGRVPRSSEFRMRRTITEARKELALGPRVFAADQAHASVTAPGELADAATPHNSRRADRTVSEFARTWNG